MFYFYIRIFFCYFLNNLAPQAAGFNNVCFIYTAYFLSSGTGSFKRFAGNTLYFKTAVFSNIICRVAIVLSAFFTEVNITGKLAEEQDVGAF